MRCLWVTVRSSWQTKAQACDSPHRKQQGLKEGAQGEGWRGRANQTVPCLCYVLGVSPAGLICLNTP